MVNDSPALAASRNETFTTSGKARNCPWTEAEDRILRAKRATDMDWGPYVQEYLPGRSAKAAADRLRRMERGEGGIGSGRRCYETPDPVDTTAEHSCATLHRLTLERVGTWNIASAVAWQQRHGVAA